MPMSPRLLRPRQTIHPEAADWANRVRTNGGSVSGTTLTAVDRFVKAIHAAGIRDRFYRLNLFAGNSDASLNAVRTPLFRGPSLTGTQYGGTTDTNVNFVQGDYAETGASGGLVGNGSTKSLNTGVAANLFSASNSHLSVGLVTPHSGTGFKALIAATTASGIAWELYGRRDAGFGNGAAGFGNATTESQRFGDNVVTAALAAGHIIAAHPTMYRNGVASGAVATASQEVGGTATLFVFAANSINGTAVNHTNARLSSYSIGLGLTASQAAAFSAAHAAFNTALSRT